VRDDQWLDHAVDTDRGGERFQRFLVDLHPWLIGVRDDGVEVDVEGRRRGSLGEGGNERVEAAPETAPAPRWRGSPRWGIRLCVRSGRHTAFARHAPGA